MKGKLVEIEKAYAEDKNIPCTIGLVLRGPYEYVIQLTKDYSSCEFVFDLLIDGSIFKLIPCAHCTRIKK